MNETTYKNLLQGIQHDDPRLYDLLKLAGAAIIKLQQEVFPDTPPGLNQQDAPLPPPELATFSYEILPDNILLSWTLSSGSAARFEIREGGLTWETSNIVIRTDTSSARIDPLLEGSHRYWIKGTDENGIYSTVALYVDIIIPAIGNLTVTAQVIDNNVLLFWTIPTSVFRISHYIVTKNGSEVGRTLSTFQSLFENVASTYTYGIQAVDIIGNVSAEAVIDVAVTQPPDYELQSDFLSDLDGTKTNVTLLDSRLLVNTRVETWEQHFADRGWLSIQDQVDAGFPIYAQPSVEVGTYVETIDYGVVISNTVLSITFNTVLIVGSGHTIVVEIETSLDDITYTPPVIATTLFVASLRYARITITFTAID